MDGCLSQSISPHLSCLCELEPDRAQTQIFGDLDYLWRVWTICSTYYELKFSSPQTIVLSLDSHHIVFESLGRFTQLDRFFWVWIIIFYSMVEHRWFPSYCWAVCMQSSSPWCFKHFFLSKSWTCAICAKQWNTVCVERAGYEAGGSVNGSGSTVVMVARAWEGKGQWVDASKG